MIRGQPDTEQNENNRNTKATTSPVVYWPVRRTLFSATDSLMESIRAFHILWYGLPDPQPCWMFFPWFVRYVSAIGIKLIFVTGKLMTWQSTCPMILLIALVRVFLGCFPFFLFFQLAEITRKKGNCVSGLPYSDWSHPCPSGYSRGLCFNLMDTVESRNNE